MGGSPLVKPTALWSGDALGSELAVALNPLLATSTENARRTPNAQVFERYRLPLRPLPRIVHLNCESAPKQDDGQNFQLSPI